MECIKVKNLLSAYQDGELKEAIRVQLKLHLLTCAGCRQEYQQLQEAWGALNRVSSIEPSANYMGRFWAKAAEETQETGVHHAIKNLLGYKRWVPALLTFCLVVIILSMPMLGEIKQQHELAQIPAGDLQMLQHMDMAANFDTVRDFTVIRDLRKTT